MNVRTAVMLIEIFSFPLAFSNWGLNGRSPIRSFVEVPSLLILHTNCPWRVRVVSLSFPASFRRVCNSPEQSSLLFSVNFLPCLHISYPPLINLCLSYFIYLICFDFQSTETLRRRKANVHVITQTENVSTSRFKIQNCTLHNHKHLLETN